MAGGDEVMSAFVMSCYSSAGGVTLFRHPAIRCSLTSITNFTKCGMGCGRCRFLNNPSSKYILWSFCTNSWSINRFMSHMNV